MADHKQATDISIATTTDQSGFSSWVFKWWKLGAVGLLVCSGGLLASYYQVNAVKKENYATWEVLTAAIPVNSPLGFAAADPDELSAVADSEANAIAGPWARYLEANARDLGGDQSGAVETLSKLQERYPGHILNDLRFSFPDTPKPLTVAERMSAAVGGQAAWEAAHPSLFKNPEPAAGGPTIRMVTTEGPITLALYPEAAPLHVENFLKLCSEGFYNGTKFHRVISGFMIQGGDPNTKEPNVELWGQGGPGYKVDAEDNDLRHFKGYLSAAKMGGETQSSGSQFFITTGTPHHLDGQHVVFGKVLDGMETVGIIESGVIALGTQDRPDTPATIVSTDAP